MNHRSNKKIKLDSNGQKKADFGRSNNKNGSSIHSGHYMTSTLHDQNEDTVEMPIASPDASINEVTLNANLNADQDNYNDHENETATNSGQSVNNKIQSSASNNLIINSNVSNLKNSTIQSNATTNTSVRKVMINGKIQVVSNSISGGITLDKTNKSLKNLMCYIKASYSNNLTSPKWKNFKGLKLQVTEKIRLNNVIWRSWFEQYGIKDNVKHRKRRLICQFANGLEEQPVSTKMSIKEGKFWKARLESIKNEYNKWREISRKQIKATNDGTQLETINIIQTFDRKTPIRIATPLGLINANTNININLNLSSSSLNSLASTSSNNNINNSTNNQASFILNNNSVQSNTNYQTSFYENNQIPSNLSNFQNFPNQPNTNYYFNHQNNTGFGVVQNDLNTPEYVVQQSTDNFANFNSNPNNIQQNNFMIQNSFQSSEIPNQNKISSVITTSTISSGSPTSSFTTSTSSTNPQTSYHHLPIASKQMPYNNRCRSPSPGLFQDFDLYNFSSDTLFSTYLVEDPKDTIFGTNPDLFQPDLMHMYPNFDFFDLQEDVFNLNETNKKQEENSPQSNSNPQSITESSSHNNSNNNLKNDNSNSNFGTQLADSTQVVVQETPDPNAQSQSQQSQLISIDYSDLSNFNTLATVAAAQSLNLTSSNNGNTNTSQQRSQKVRHMSDIGDFNHLKNSNQSMINDVNHHQLKLPVSLSQINTNLNSNPIQQQQQQQVQTTPQQFNSITNSSNTNFTRSISSNQQTNTTSTNSTNSSNTIRNLLALNSPSIQMQTNNNNTNNNTNSNNSNKQNINNIRLLTGVLTASGNSIPSSNRKAHQQQIYQQQQQNLTNLINNSNQPRVQSPPNMMLQSSSQNQAKVVKSDSNQPFTSLLSAVLGTNQSNDMQINQVIPNQTQEQLMDQLQSLNKTSNRRGRKAANETIINQTINQRGNSKGSSSRNSSQHKLKKDELIINPSQQLSNQMNSNMININEATDSSSNSPTQSPHNNFNPSFQAQQIQASSSNSNFQANDSNSNEFSLLSKYNRINSNPPSSSAKPNELYPPPPSVNGSISGSRMSRSNSVNSLNAMNESNFTSAEQKRRCNIQHGFDRLQVLVPALRDGKNLKVSKAVMLQKTSEYIKELQQAREKRMTDLEIYKKEIEELSDKITECQNELPANGVSVVGNLNKTEKFEQKFNQYVKDKTLNNWKFYLFSLILKPLFDNFIQTVNTSSKEDMEKTFYEWQQKYCNLVQLRPIASTALRHLSRSTSILTDSSKLPEECYSMALTKI